MPQVQSSRVESLADAKVDILNKEDTRQWDHGLIEGMFTPEEAELITSIPLSRCEAETQSEQMAHEKILCRTLWSL